MIRKYINNERLFSALMLYGFLIALYGINGLQISTYIVFGATYIYHLNTIIDKLMLETGDISSKINEIDTMYLYIIISSIIILILVARSWQLVIYFLVIGLIFIFIKNIAVLLMSKT